MTAPPRILAYCAAIFGLGHERRTLAILGEVSRRVPEAQMLLVTGTPPRLANRQPAGLDVLLLPNAKRHGKATGVRAAVLLAAIEAFKPDLILVEEEPAGHAAELLPALEAIEAMPLRPVLAVCMRDILNEARFARSYARSHGHDTAQERFYDHTLIFGDPSVFDPVAEYGWSPSVAARTTMCGYIRPADAIAPPAKVRAGLGIGEQPFVVVTTGGGSDGGKLLETAIDALARPELRHLAALVVTGPLGERLLPALRTRAASRPGIMVESFRDDLTSDINAADLVVAMAGVNTASEIVALGKRAVLVPRKHGEQELRADLFAQRGLVQTFRWAELSPERLATAMLAALDSPPPVNTLAFDGLAIAGAILAEALQPQFTPFDG
jgi:predicted glycosyltransferase